MRLALIASVLFLTMFATAEFGYDNENLPILKPEPTGSIVLPENTTLNVTSNSSNYWETDVGSLSTVNNTQFDNSAGILNLDVGWLTSLGDDIWCKLTGCTMDGNIDMGTNDITNVGSVYANHINATTGNFTDIYVSNESIYIGDNIKMTASTLNGSVLNITGGNLSAEYYYGSGQFLTDINLTGVSFNGGDIQANSFNGSAFYGGNFYGTYDWVAESPWLVFNGTYLYFNETKLEEEAEVTLQTETTIVNVVGGVGTATTSNVIDFEIKQIDVTCSSGTSFRFEASENTTGDIIDRDRKQHNTRWSIVKSYPIQDMVDLTITNANPTSDTCTVEIKYLDNFE